MMVLNPEMALDQQDPDGAKWASAPRFTERLHYRRDGVGFTERGFRHLFLVAADGGAARQVTRGDWNVGESVYEYINTVDWAFTPDGRSAIVTGFKEGDPDRNDQDCYVYSAVDLETGATKRLTSVTVAATCSVPRQQTITYVSFPRNGDGYREFRFVYDVCGPGATPRCDRRGLIASRNIWSGRRTAARSISPPRITAVFTFTRGRLMVVFGR